MTFCIFKILKNIKGGSALTCVRHVVGVDVTPEAVAEAIKLQNLDALIVIGGFEA